MRKTACTLFIALLLGFTGAGTVQAGSGSPPLPPTPTGPLPPAFTYRPGLAKRVP